jgi:hypothetical protein
MSENDPFEKTVQRQQIKPLPKEWRSQILVHARTAAGPNLVEEPRSATDRVQGVSAVFNFLKTIGAELLFPGRKAWASLGMAWALIIFAAMLSRDEDAGGSSSADRPSPLAQELLKEQAQLLSEFSGASDLHDVVTPRRPEEGPRSQTQWQRPAV